MDCGTEKGKPERGKQYFSEQEIEENMTKEGIEREEEEIEKYEYFEGYEMKEIDYFLNLYWNEIIIYLLL